MHYAPLCGDPMKKSAGLLLLLVATVCCAKTRDWKPGTVIDVSETSVSGPLIPSSNIMHYTVETDVWILFLDYSYHPSSKTSSPDSKNSPPRVAVNVAIKIAIEGRHAYVLDETGKEVKLHITKRMKK
jgi:hypothetical protein